MKHLKVLFSIPFLLLMAIVGFIFFGLLRLLVGIIFLPILYILGIPFGLLLIFVLLFVLASLPTTSDYDDKY